MAGRSDGPPEWRLVDADWHAVVTAERIQGQQWDVSTALGEPDQIEGEEG